MSARATFWAWEIDLSSSDKLVLLCLSDCHNADTGQCNPSVGYICRKTGLNKKTTLKSLRSLYEQGLMNKTKVEGSSNWYTLNIGSTKFDPPPGVNLGQGGGVKTGHKPISKPKKNLRWENGDMEVAEHIYKSLLALNPKHKKPNLESWANDIRLMREQDNHSIAEIRQMFTYAHNDRFWRANILSPGKLRDKWDTLALRKGQESSPNTEIWV